MDNKTLARKLYGALITQKAHEKIDPNETYDDIGPNSAPHNSNGMMYFISDILA